LRHHRYHPEFSFVKDPVDFNKYTERQLLQYCLGATMYMPGTKDFAQSIINKRYPGLTSMVLCFEDACRLEDVPMAEQNALTLLNRLLHEIEEGSLAFDDIPLIFFRPRNVEQFKHFTKLLKPEHYRLICGFNFPVFNSENGEAYMAHLEALNREIGEVVYAMPILEDQRIAFKETRLEELLAVRAILDRYHDLVLNIRVGGTDFSSYFSVRRGINYTIYDIMTVTDCLKDILNLFARNNDYTVSGAVWEYFRASKEMRFQELPDFDFQESLIKRQPIVNDAVDGLMRELILDKANGFVGKTIIHPSHLNFVNAMFAVTREEFEDATQILNTSGGVIKSSTANKMNEIEPHRNWAQKLIYRAQAYGVIENQTDYLNLIGSY
jgi:citrate lyase beta subunit